MLTPTEPNRFHRVHSRARGYALSSAFLNRDLDFPIYRGKRLVKSQAEEHTALLLQLLRRPQLQKAAPHSQAAREANAVASSLLESTSPPQA